jgi:general stress protein YciG
MELTMDKKKLLQEALREIGRKGGKASAKKLTAAERRDRARRAGLAGGRGRGKKGGTR